MGENRRKRIGYGRCGGGDPARVVQGVKRWAEMIPMRVYVYAWGCGSGGCYLNL